MPKFYSAEKPQKEKADELANKLREYPEFKPRLAFLYPVNEGRQSALDILELGKITDLKKIENLLESDDFIEREAGFYILGNLRYSDKMVSENLKRLLDEIYAEKFNLNNSPQNTDDSVAMVKMNILVVVKKEEAFSEIKESIICGFPSEKSAAIRALYLGGLDERKSLVFLQEIIDDIDDVTKQSIAEEAGIFGERSLPLLEKLIEGSSNDVRIAAIKTKINIFTKLYKEKSLPFLEEMSSHNEWAIRMAVVKAAKVIGLAAAPLLEKLSKDEIFDVYDNAKTVLSLLKSGGYEWLLATKKPLFASFSTEDLAKKLMVLEGIVDDMKKKFKDDFIGVVVVGSVSKGYFYKDEGSDIDGIVIARDKSAVEYFKNEAKSIGMCRGLDECFGAGYIGVDDEYKILYGDPGGLFKGIFFGDRRKLLKAQKKVLADEDKRGWDKIREHILHTETSLGKAARRFDIFDVELKKIKQFIALLKVPPSLKEAREIINNK